jgi:hypothetical protein
VQPDQHALDKRATLFRIRKFPRCSSIAAFVISRNGCVPNTGSMCSFHTVSAASRELRAHFLERIGRYISFQNAANVTASAKRPQAANAGGGQETSRYREVPRSSYLECHR